METSQPPPGPGPLVVLGLDGVPPSLLFGRFREETSRIQAFLSHGTFGPLRTCEPPITVPAWAVMFSGYDPGTLGLYGFRHRPSGSYRESYTPRSGSWRRPALWEVLSRRGRRVAVLGMPPAYPPPRVHGISLSDFLTPPGARDAMNPEPVQREMEGILGEPLRFDVEFRLEDRQTVFEGIRHLTRQRFALAREVWRRGPWDLFVVHDIGPDRLHHALWKYFDESHPRHPGPHPYQDLPRQYYEILDEEVGRFLQEVPRGTRVLLVSDHGAKAMVGGFCLNQWLRDQGYLVLRSDPAPGTPLEEADVHWERTRVWGAGGYYGRIFLNLAGREEKGCVLARESEDLLSDLIRELGRVRPPNGPLWGVRATRPRDCYATVAGDAPDLMVYFGDLSWRSIGSMGHPSLFVEENDTGPDEAVHDWQGIYGLARAGGEGSGGAGSEVGIQDVAPTLYRLLGEEPPSPLPGRPVASWLRV
jgi:predicted AlkP superfamily phosphohydrolase/phosphomutase